MYEKISKHSFGFTLIELLFVFSVVTILATFGIASFVTYSRSQVLSVAVLDISSFLNLAKSRASSQVKPSVCGSNVLEGYKVTLCGLSGSVCQVPGEYQLRVVCGSAEEIIQRKKLPKGIQFDSTSGQTTSTSYFFKTLSGGVDGMGRIVVRGFDNSRSVEVDATGNVRIN